MITRYATQANVRKRAFLDALASDLRLIGVSASVRRRRSSLFFTMDDAPFVSEGFSEKAGAALRMRELAESAAFISAVEDSSAFSLFVSGSDVDPDKITPSLMPCVSRSDNRLHNYCRLLQSVPNRPRPGRRLRLLILDQGQIRPALMGAVELASPLYSMGARDSYFGWHGVESAKAKEVGLRRIMDMSLCIAVPPYSYLLGGKLIAMLATSDPVRDLFRKRYGDPLVAIVTTCASGLHCPIFNRIMTRPGGLYRRIGATRGYGTIIFSRATTTAAGDLVKAMERWRPREYRKTIPLLRQALAACGISQADRLLRVGVAKGVYMAELVPHAQRALASQRVEENILDRRLSVAGAVEVWRRFVHARTTHALSLEAMRRYNASELLLSRLL